jgi:hypothetical protein
MSTRDYIEYVSIYQDKDLNKYTDTWDVIADFPDEKFILGLLEDYANKQDLELIWVAKGSKTVFYEEDTDTFNTVYNTDFKEVNIYD